jgi:matrix metalloproteinase-16 (membrane-inserted)
MIMRFYFLTGKTYFFKGKGFWEFDDLRMRVAHEKQKLSAPVWMGCPPPEIETNDIETNLPRKSKIISASSAAAAAATVTAASTLLMLAIVAMSFVARIT